MTIASTDSKISYAGNGSTTVFAVPFYFLANGDLRVVLVDALGAETDQTYTTHYTLTGAGDPDGGSLTMVTAPASGKTLVILREPEITQEVQYVENDDFPASSHEMALDRLTMICQALDEKVGRAVKVGLLGGDPDELIDGINQAVSDSAASAASALAAKAAAETAQAAAEAAAASVPDDALVPGDIGSTVQAYDATILKAADIGVSVQAYDAHTMKDNVVTARTRQHYDTPVAVTSSSGSLALDCDLHAEATITLSENTTVAAPSNRAAGKYIVLHVTGASTYTLSWDAVFKARSDMALPAAPAAGKVLSVCFRCINATDLQLVGYLTGV